MLILSVGTVRLYKGIGLFLAGSALCGLSRDMTQLIVFFAVQGIGAGALMPIGMTIIGDLFPPERRGKMQGLFGAVLELYFSLPRARGSIPVRMKKSWRFLFVFEH